jgi:hypothetical protein
MERCAPFETVVQKIRSTFDMVSFKKLRQMVQVKGNGNLISKTYPVSSFLRLHIAVTGLTELIQSEEEKVEVELDENLVDYFSAVNSGSTLFVTTEGVLRTPVFTRAVVRIYLRQLDHLVVRCEGGDVVCPQLIHLQSPLDVKVQTEGNTELNFQSPQLKVMLQAEGNVTLKGRSGIVDIKNQSEGHLFAKDLIAKELTLKNQALGNVEVFAEEKISISHSGQGYIHYYGSAQLMKIQQHGDGEVKHCKD